MTSQAMKIRYIAVAVISIIMFTISLATGGGAQFASAAASSYTNVLTDLKKDESFNIEDYPEVLKNYSLNVIQVAESVDGELFVYVYQPSGQRVDLLATTVRFSTSRNEDGARWNDYSLTFINSNGVFFKYKVNGFTVLPDDTRYYNVTAIHRKWYSAIDSNRPNQIVSGVVYPVGALWEATTENGEVTYSKYTSETVEVTTKRVGLIRAGNGFGVFNETACDDHYVAFSCDRRIDELYDADVEFRTRTYSNNINGINYGEYSENQVVTITSLDTGANPGGGLGATHYSWKCIQTSEEFIEQARAAGVSMKAEEEVEFKQYQYVLHFLATEYSSKVTIGWMNVIGGIAALCGAEISSGTDVADVSILRLHFQSEGETYNLGVVDNKQTNPTPTPGISGSNGGVGGFLSGCSGTGCNSALPWWAWLLIFTLGPLTLILLYVTAYLIISAIFRRNRERRTNSPKPAKNKHSKGSTGKRRHKKGGKK